MNIEQKDTQCNDLIPYSYFAETYKADPTSPTGLRYVKKDRTAGSKNGHGYRVMVKGRKVCTRRVIEALENQTDIDLTNLRSKHLPLNERFKVDPMSPSGLSWLVPSKEASAGDPAGQQNTRGYYTISQGQGPKLRAHNIVFELTHGRPCRPGYEVDHIDRDPGNNRPDNLREVTRQQNAWNKVGRETHWFPKGVYMSAGTVRAKVGGQVIGTFKDHSDQSSEKLNALIAATLEAMQELHGEYGCYDSYYCQLPDCAVMGPDEGWP